MNHPPVEAAEDPFFRQLVSLASSLAISGMLASLAAVEKGAVSGRLEFHWHWAVLPLGLIGLGLGHVFWRLLWQAQRDNRVESQRRVRWFAALLGLIAISSFLYPLRYLQPERRSDVFIGFGLAVVVLTAFGFLIAYTIRMVGENEPRDGECDPPDESDDKP
jgi:hypothetical protein